MNDNLTIRAAPPRRSAPAASPPIQPSSATQGKSPVSESRLDDVDALFRGFADPTRLRLLSALVPGPLCVSDLVEVLRLPQPLVSRHLAYLRRVGLVQAERATRYAHYRLADPRGAVHSSLLGCVRSCFVGIESLDAERAAAAQRSRRVGDRVP